MKKFLLAKPTLWFLFLFNLVVAMIVPFTVDGTQGITAAIGMGLVSVKAGFGLLWQKRRSERVSRAACA